MKIKHLLTKTLLVAAGLLLGGANSVWAGEVSTIYTKALSDWSSDDIVTTETAGKWLTSTSGDANRGLFIVADKGLMTRTRGKTNIDTGTLLLSRTANTIVTLDAVWNVGDSDASGSHANGYNQFCSIQYGDLLVKCCLDNRSTDYSYTIKGVKTSLGAAAGTLLNTDLTIHLVVNSTTNEISEFYIKNGETTLAQFSDLTAANNAFTAGSDYDRIITKSDISNVSSTNDFNYLKSITVQQETQSVPTANVTFKYEDTKGNSLSAYKADQVASDVALGTEIATLIPTYNATFYNGEDNKYVYSSYVVTGDYTTVQDGGNTVTLKFTDYPATAYTVKAQVSGSDLTTLASGTAFLDGSTTAYWSRYINESGNWYKADATTYGTAITAASANVDFTATDAVSYFFEAESMDLSREYGSISKNSSYSGGAGKGVYAGATLTSTSKVSPGEYTFSIGSVTRTADKDQSYKVSYSTNGTDFIETGKIISFTTAAGSSEQSVAEVLIPAEAYVRLKEGTGGNAYDYVDYVVLKKTDDVPATVPVTITSAGFATLYTLYPLDFSTTGLTAYTASYDGSTVTLTPVDNVPENTGVVLEGAADDYNIPVIASSSTAKGDLQGNASAATAYNAFDGFVLYMLADKGDGNVQFKKVSTGSITAGKAFLKVAAGSGSPAFDVVFEGNLTGISEIKTMRNAENEIFFDLQGRKVANPTKGLYIVNGRKAIIK